MEYIEVHQQRIKARGYSPRTVADRVRLLRQADAALPHGLIHAAPQEIDDFLATDGWGIETRSCYHGHLAGFYTHMTAGHDPYLTLNPMADMPRPRVPAGVPDPVTDEELHRSLALSPPKWQLVILLAAFPGLRRAEICALRRQDITAERIHVINGKGGRDRYVRTPPQVWALVEPMPPGPLLRRRDGQAMKPGGLGVMACRHFKRIGMPEIHLHRYRHYSATAQTQEGVPTAVVARNMGHQSLATTARYIGVSDQQAGDAMGLLYRRHERLSSTPEPVSTRLGGAAA